MASVHQVSACVVVVRHSVVGSARSSLREHVRFRLGLASGIHFVGPTQNSRSLTKPQWSPRDCRSATKSHVAISTRSLPERFSCRCWAPPRFHHAENEPNAAQAGLKALQNQGLRPSVSFAPKLGTGSRISNLSARQIVHITIKNGRRTRLRIWRSNPWGFKSPLSHHPSFPGIGKGWPKASTGVVREELRQVRFPARAIPKNYRDASTDPTQQSDALIPPDSILSGKRLAR